MIPLATSGLFWVKVVILADAFLLRMVPSAVFLGLAVVLYLATRIQTILWVGFSLIVVHASYFLAGPIVNRVNPRAFTIFSFGSLATSLLQDVALVLIALTLSWEVGSCACMTFGDKWRSQFRFMPLTDHARFRIGLAVLVCSILYPMYAVLIWAMGLK